MAKHNKPKQFDYGQHTLQDLIDFKNKYFPNLDPKDVHIIFGDFEGNYSHRNMELFTKGNNTIDIGYEMHEGGADESI